MGKAAIYNPYLDTLGGGERYTLTFAKVLAEEGYDVDIEWYNKLILDTMSQRFGLKLPNNIKVVDSINRGDKYDLCFWVSDGSVPMLRSSKNYIHFQVPFHNVGGDSLLNKMKLFRVDKIICNSNFTKQVIDKEYKVTSEVLYPPIDVNSFKSKRKENVILYVGRFSNLLQSKGQDTLIKSFKKLYDDGFTKWKLILAGGVEVGANIIVNELKKMIGDYPIEIIESPSFLSLKELYGKAKIFWSASGYGVDSIKNPQMVEHFGMTLVEAMAAGVAPIVVNAGGHNEIIDNGKNGYLWNNQEELLNLTENLINTSGLCREISKSAVVSSKKYGYEEFKNKINEIL